MSDAEKAHLITDSVYKNILDNFNPGVKQLVSFGRAYQKAIHNVAMAAKSFVDCLTKIGQSAEAGKGGVSDIGGALLQIADLYKEINTSLIDNIKVFHAELLIPLETKQENEFKQVNLIYKKYSTGHKFHATPFEKAQSALKKQKKKNKTKFGFDEKEMQYSREVKEYQAKLEEYHIQSLRTALIEERKRYCFLLDRMCAMIRNNAAHHSKSHDLLTKHMTEWTRLSRRPNMLPQSSEALVQSFRNLQSVQETGRHRENHLPLTGHYKLQPTHMATPGIQPMLQAESQEDVYNIPDGEGDISDMRQDSFDPHVCRNVDTGSLTYGSSNGGMPQQEYSGRSSGDSGFITVTIPSPPNERPQVKALYNHTGNNETQLSFNEGDTVALIGERKDGWQYGENIGTKRMGWFPLTFTQPIASGSRQTGMGHHRVKSLGDISTSGLDESQLRDRSQTMADVRQENVYDHSLLQVVSSPVADQEKHKDRYIMQMNVQHSQTNSGAPQDPPPLPPEGAPHVHFNMATNIQPMAQEPPLPPPPPPVPQKQPLAPPLQRYLNSPSLQQQNKGTHSHHRQNTTQGHPIHNYNYSHVAPPGSYQQHYHHQQQGMNYTENHSPANSSSGYSGGSHRNVNGYSHHYHQNQGDFPPPPPPQLDPPPPPHNREYGTGQYMRNPFTNVKLKKAQTNDRSDPRIYIV